MIFFCLRVLHRGFKDLLSSEKNLKCMFELSLIIFKISRNNMECRVMNSIIYFLDTLCAFRFCGSGCFSSIWIGECLKHERWMLLCCLDDGSSWWLCNMFMGKHFYALDLGFFFFFANDKVFVDLRNEKYEEFRIEKCG